ncbi:uncharacterized protein TNCV_470071 [Trichonephila clavipes]|nr:uncharacterized protein TNCV_470071 [Trichonephila clavipes]
MSSNTRCSGLSRQRGYSTSRMASAFSDLNPIENVGCFGEASCWSKLSSDKQEHPNPCTRRRWDKLPQQLLDNVVQTAVAEWSRYRIVAGLVMSSSPIPLKTRRVGQRCTLNLPRAQTSFRWCGVVVKRGASSGVAHVT